MDTGLISLLMAFNIDSLLEPAGNNGMQLMEQPGVTWQQVSHEDVLARLLGRLEERDSREEEEEEEDQNGNQEIQGNTAPEFNWPPSLPGGQLALYAIANELKTPTLMELQMLLGVGGRKHDYRKERKPVAERKPRQAYSARQLECLERGMNALICIRLPSEEARKDFLDATFKHNAPFVLSIEPDDIVSFVKKDPKEDGSAKIAHPMNSMDHAISTGEPIRLPFTPVGYPNTNEFGHIQAQVSSVTNALEMSQASDFSFRQAQAGNTIIQNAFFSSSGPIVFDREQQEAPIFTTSTNPFRSENVVQDTHSLPIHPADSNGPDDLFAEPVVKEEFEQSNAAKQANSSSIFSEASPKTPITRSFYRQMQVKDTVDNAAVESIFQQNDYEVDPSGLFAPDAVVKEECDQSDNQVPPPISPVDPIDQEEPYDIFQDIKPQHIDLDQPRVVVAEIDLIKVSDIIKKEDLDDDLDEEMKEEAPEEVGDEEDSSDAGAHLDPKDKTYTPKGSAKKTTCDECQKELHDATSLRRHRRIHSGEKPYNCDICSNRFSRRHSLLIHLRSHTGEKPFACEVCQKTFSVRSNYKSHMLIHSGEKPFSCDICKKSFRHAKTMTSHMRSHTGEKPFECKNCKAKFTQMSSLKRHRLSRHS